MRFSGPERRRVRERVIKVTVLITPCALLRFGGNTDRRAGRVRERVRESGRSSARERFLSGSRDFFWKRAQVNGVRA